MWLMSGTQSGTQSHPMTTPGKVTTRLIGGASMVMSGKQAFIIALTYGLAAHSAGLG